ncbi:uncharacterized protein LOC123671073 [Harmonia axyridis]|uniref:uncharacterized protein LOC123671073 n=1 Tax=Harmonia axyridis TaxID=115357 RepID=UPI001E279D0C|nr:uncharacterized protein LOC123671073 [Harmonia axyridis]
MNLAHIFSDKSKEALSKFIEASKKCENYHDFKSKEEEEEYKMWSKIMNKFEEIDNKIQSTSSKEDNVSIEKESNSNHDTEDSKILEALTSELRNAIEDCLENKLECDYLIKDIKDEPVEKIREIYRQCLPRFDVMKLIEMGEKIINVNPNDSIVECYCTELLFQMMSQSCKDNLKIFFYEFYAQYSRLVTKTITQFLEVQDELKTFLLYINKSSTKENELLVSLLREFLLSYNGPLTKKHLMIMDYLTDQSTEYNSNKMIIDILSDNATEYKNDKDYGKLIVKITENLGPEVDSLREQIESILNIHASIWKMKLKKLMNKYSNKM